MILHAPKSTFDKTRDDIKAMAKKAAADLRKAAEVPASGVWTPGGGGSRPRGLPEELRQRVIEVRTALYQRGLYDPILVRFDSATVAEATTLAIADELERVAEALS